MFYPADAGSLAGTVDELLHSVAGEPADTPPAAVVVPHAGYRFSGIVAAAAYARLPRRSGCRVVLLGPAHFARVAGLVAPEAAAWRTPLGEVQVDQEARDLAGMPGDDLPHAREHAVEVQLPFLQRLFGSGLSVLPVAVGRCSPDKVADTIDLLLAAGDRLAIVSTDLSHYLDDSTARRRDARTAAAIRAHDVAAVRDEDACGASALRGLLAWAARHEPEIRQLDLRTSADASGDRDRVVGYGAFELTR